MLHGPDEQNSSISTTKHLEPDANIKAKQKSSELQGKSFINIHSYLLYREIDRLRSEFAIPAYRENTPNA